MHHRISSVLIILILSGCASQGRVTLERTQDFKDGRRVTERLTVKTPEHPNAPGSVQITSDGTISVSTGSEPTVTPGQRSLARLPMLGAGMLLVGMLLLVLKAKIPLIPAEVGIGTALVGLLLIVLPSIIEAYLGWIVLGLVGAAGAVTIYRVNGLGKKQS